MPAEPWWFHGNLAATPAAYARDRVVAFTLAAVAAVVAAFLLTPWLLTLGAFSVLAALVWWRRWRQLPEFAAEGTTEQHPPD